MLSKQKTAQLQFLTWVNNTHPALYDAAVASVDNSELSGMGAADNKPSFWNKIGTALTGLGTTYLSLKNQRDAMRLNLQRAQNGLPPIDAAFAAPVIRTQIDLPPDVVNRIAAGAGMQFNKVLLFGGAAILAFLLIKRR